METTIQELHLERQSLIRERDLLDLSSDNISQIRVKIIDNRLSELQALVDEKTLSSLDEQAERNKKLEEEKKMSENPKDVVKAKHASVTKAYDALVEEYRQNNERNNAIRKEKDVLRGLRDKLYALKKAETLTPEDQKFLDSVEV